MEVSGDAENRRVCVFIFLLLLMVAAADDREKHVAIDKVVYADEADGLLALRRRDRREVDAIFIFFRFSLCCVGVCVCVFAIRFIFTSHTHTDDDVEKFKSAPKMKKNLPGFGGSPQFNSRSVTTFFSLTITLNITHHIQTYHPKR